MNATRFESIIETMLPALLQGDRAAVRTLVSRTLASGATATRHPARPSRQQRSTSST